MEEGMFGPLLLAKFHTHRWNVSPLRGEKPQNRPLSKLNTGRFALRAMLPVTTAFRWRLWDHAVTVEMLTIFDGVMTEMQRADRVLLLMHSEARR